MCSVLLKQKIAELSTFGRFPEIEIQFENGARCISFMIAEQHPSWTLFDRTKGKVRYIYSKYGRIEIEESNSLCVEIQT